MNVFRLNQSLIKLIIIPAFLIMCSLFMAEYVSSQKQWNRENIIINYNQEGNSIQIRCNFIDYEFGPWGEHAYIEWADFEYSLNGLPMKTFLLVKLKIKCERTYRLYI